MMDGRKWRLTAVLAVAMVTALAMPAAVAAQWPPEPYPAGEEPGIFSDNSFDSLEGAKKVINKYKSTTARAI
ncbi:MAG: hypothetical protein ACRD5F_16490 [Candidatus Acidiferrales bacterium]